MDVSKRCVQIHVHIPQSPSDKETIHSYVNRNSHHNDNSYKNLQTDETFICGGEKRLETHEDFIESSCIPVIYQFKHNAPRYHEGIDTQNKLDHAQTMNKCILQHSDKWQQINETLHGHFPQWSSNRFSSKEWSSFRFKIVCIVSLVLLQSCPAVSNSSDSLFSFPDSRQESFAKELSDFHISWPSRVDHKKEFITHNIHPHNILPHRHKRDVNSSKIYQHQDDNSASYFQSDSIIHYHIPLHKDKSDVVVSVFQTDDILISPSAVVERKTSKYRNISDSIFSMLDHHRGCHLSGRVINALESRVALSACKGLRGFVHIDGEDYLIEPVKGHVSKDVGPTPHLVYKRSALSDYKDVHRAHKGTESGCGVGESFEKIIAKRERWEKKRRRREPNTAPRPTFSASRSSLSFSSPLTTPHRRKRRSISTEKHVETLVVVDTDMIRYYENEDIETYVLTVMNMVANLYHDASIGNAINIVIVRIILLQDPDENLTIMHHADKTLKNFCKWQKRINFRDDDHPNHHDVAVLLTRKNICSRMNKPCSTLGLAQVAGLCQPHKTCSINEDTGLSLAWTVAHEVGHNFGMKHDTASTGCVSTSAVQYVMAPNLSWDKTPYRWSDCSREAITTFLDRNWGYCLDDSPGHHDFQYPLLPAGTMYNSDHQCALLYGDGAQRCNGIEELENICTTLWCKVNNKCSTKLQAAAVGTICGTDKWCFNGDCVDIGDRPEAINGQWGEWSQWTSCTRTCGAGVKVSQRHCNHPPPSNGGKYCTGERKRYRICNTEICPENDMSFRSVQCAEFNQIPYMGMTYEWKDVHTPESPCQLHCKPKNKYFSVMLKDIVSDGTPCVIGSRHMCISGRCRHVGCDWVIDSDAKEDQCGVCFGNGSTCKTIKQQFNETKQLGYVEATVIPPGARNIHVEEVAEASNFLALKNEKGEYYLNGHWFIQWSGDYEVAGTVVHYTRLGNRESFKVPGPTKEPLHIMLLMQTHNPGVLFEYTVPKENATDNRKPEFSWEVTGWSHCTVSCGGGTQRSAVICKEQEMGLVDDIHCNLISPKPDDKLRACNSHLCPARWWTGPWQHCSVTCGEDGQHRRTVICVRSLGSDEQIALEDAACANSDKPPEFDVCHRVKKCDGLGIWETSDWSNCTRECDGGVQYRKVVCVGGDICDGEKPNSEQPCNEKQCKKKIKAITKNNTLVGKRDVSSSKDRRITSDLYIGGPLARNNSMNQSIHRIDKTGVNYKMNSNREKNVSINKVVRIGKAVVDRRPKNGKTYNNQHKNINADSVKEDRNRHASSDSNLFSNGQDRHFKYNRLFQTQQFQLHRRHRHNPQHKNNKQHHISKESSDSLVNGNPNNIPANSSEGGSYIRRIFTKSNSAEPVTNIFEWRTRRWNKCSVKCGTGVQTRDVVCLDTRTHKQLDRKFCRHIKSRPSALKECYGKCLKWKAGEWEECSATCGYAVQKRTVTCRRHGKCNMTKKPLEIKICPDIKPCVSWMFGAWSQCSESCGEGIQMRLVQCVNLTSLQLSEGCTWNMKPSTKQECNDKRCMEDNIAALTLSCESNEMSYRVCRMLRKVGLCNRDYVKARCCRTCQHHTQRRLPSRSRSE